jgi:hypothetical protein
MELTKAEKDFLYVVFLTYFEDALGKNVSGEYTDDVVMLDNIADTLGI